MANFNDRVQSIVDERYRRMLDLFLVSEDRTGDLESKLDTLLKALPLIQDIKTEVNSIEKVIKDGKPKDDDDEDEDDPVEEEPTSGDDEIDFLEMLDDLSHLIPKGKAKELLLDSPKYPAIPGKPFSGSRPGLDAMDVLRILNYLYKKTKEIKKHVNDSIMEFVEGVKAKQVEALLNTITLQTNKIYKELTHDIRDNLNDIKKAVEECCSQASDNFDNVKDLLDQIKNKVNTLTPETDANKELALLTQSKAILAEVQSIRGLL